MAFEVGAYIVHSQIGLSGYILKLYSPGVWLVRILDIGRNTTVCWGDSDLLPEPPMQTLARAAKDDRKVVTYLFEHELSHALDVE